MFWRCASPDSTNLLSSAKDNFASPTIGQGTTSLKTRVLCTFGFAIIAIVLTCLSAR